MWGQVTQNDRAIDRQRIIPTRVGTSLSSFFFILPPPDHPHACGDKSLKIATLLYLPGSSPRVWGQAILKLEEVLCARIIPTRVGTRPPTKIDTVTGTDHPHACGDKKQSYSFHKGGVGSSPRVWGQVKLVFWVVLLAGIIPTRVGTSQFWRGYRGYFQDHPHACGDKYYYYA